MVATLYLVVLMVLGRPVMTYIAKCPNGCATFKGDTGNVWVKIDQWGWDKTAVSGATMDDV